MLPSARTLASTSGLAATWSTESVYVTLLDALKVAGAVPFTGAVPLTQAPAVWLVQAVGGCGGGDGLTVCSRRRLGGMGTSQPVDTFTSVM